MVTLGLLVYLVYALFANPSDSRGECDDTEWLVANRPVCRGPFAVRQAPGTVHGARVQRRADVSSTRSCGRSSASFTRSVGWIHGKSSIGRRTRRRCCCSVWPASCSSIALQRLQHVLPLNPQGFLIPRRQTSAFNTAVSFHRKHQLAVLCGRKHHELSVADGRPDGAKLCVGGGGHRPGHRADSRLRPPLGADCGQLLGGFSADHIVGAAAAVVYFALVLIWQGVPQNLQPYVDATTVEGGSQSDRAGAGGFTRSHQDARHQRAAAFSTPIQRIPMRTPRRYRISSKC